MKDTWIRAPLLAALLWTLACSPHAPLPPHHAAADLGGTSWQLVQFQGSEDTILTPEDKTTYTITFATDGRVSVRFDCNRGHGTWQSPGPQQLVFGPLVLTRMLCLPTPLNERLAKDWAFVRSYTITDGHLVLLLLADGGHYVFEPMRPEGRMHGTVQGTAASRERIVLPPAAWGP